MNTLQQAERKAATYSAAFPKQEWAIIQTPQGHIISDTEKIDWFADGELISLWRNGRQVA